MKLTSKQRKELDVLRWFARKPEAITDSDVQDYFAYSDRGEKKELGKALLQPKNFSEGIVTLLQAKKNREVTVKMWMEDWGGNLNAWSFMDESLYMAEWIAETLDRPAILWAWHVNKSNEHRRHAYRLNKQLNNRHNKPLTVRRS